MKTGTVVSHRSVHIRWVFCCCIALSFAWESATGFRISMMSDYRPPVKSSVKKLYDRRYTDSVSIGTGNTNNLQRTRPSTNHLHPSQTSSTSAKASYAGTLSIPAPSFEERMRKAVLGSPISKSNIQRPGSRSTSRQGHLPSNVQTIETLQEYKRVVGDEREKIVAVRFFASYCKACQAVAPHYYKLARDFPDAIFVDVPVTAKNAALHQGLGVNSLPFAHIYHPTAGLVEEHKLTRKDVANFKEILRRYVVGKCDIAGNE